MAVEFTDSSEALCGGEGTTNIQEGIDAETETRRRGAHQLEVMLTPLSGTGRDE